jgi:hypothetical protein
MAHKFGSPFARGMAHKFGSPKVLTESDMVEVNASVETYQLKIELKNAQNLGRLSEVLVVIPYTLS